MNPRYAPSAAKPKASKTKNEALFAAEVYRDEETGEPADTLGDELAQLRTELRGEARALRHALSRPRVPAELLAELASLRKMVDELVVTPRPGDAASTAIASRGIEGAAAATLARIANTTERGKDRHADITVRLRDACASLVQVSPWPIELSMEEPTLIALVGPAGVGKTTTAAKLAAQACMARKTVALVSCDAFRVGAMQQLGKYAELMEARFHTATTQDELMDVILNEDADVIIVDTSGRAVQPGSTEAQLGAPELRNADVIGRRVEVLLCVPATLRAGDATRVHRDFSCVMPTAIAVTKLDETDTPAGIIHAAYETRLPVSTLCAGQRVPEDILPATEEVIGSYLFPVEARKHQ
jgi:flagellar biosynthesis protein FlhF